MKFTFVLFACFLNFYNPFLIKAEEIVNSSNNSTGNTSNRKPVFNNESDINTIHIVEVGDTITSISKLYAITKEFIIKLNDLKDENYIYVGQNLKISEKNQKTENNTSQNIYHLVKEGENLTQISVKYGLDLKLLKEINNLKDQNSIEVGSKIFLGDKNMTSQEISQKSNSEGVSKLISEKDNRYGPIEILQNELEEVNNRKILNALNHKNRNIIISVRCETKDLDVKVPNRKWKGWKPAKDEFEKNIIKDFC